MAGDRIEDCENLRDALPALILGSLDADESHVVLEHVATCAECHDAIQKDTQLLSQVLLSDVDLEIEVPASIKQGLMKKIKEIPQQKPGVRLERAGVLVVRAPEVPWLDTKLPGMQWRPLSSPRFDDRNMSIFRMKAGCTFPGHRHEGLEELYMLSGTLLVEGMRLNPGDYCRAELGSTHSPLVALTDVEFLLSTDATSMLPR
jgi:anti-sigma factor ChrR (cupin superfamily)